MYRSNLCTECDRRFTYFHSLRKHVKKFHPQKLEEIAPLKKKVYPFQCSYCKNNFSHRRNMTKHLKTHSETDLLRNNMERTVEHLGKKCPVCDYVGKFKSDLYCHYETEHNIKVESEELKFSSYSEFVEWLKNTENVSRTKFIADKGSTSTKANYKCNRSGFFKSKSTGQRHLKTQGSKKINGFCPASLQVSVDKDGSHKVTFVKTHVGHQGQLCHLSLSSEEREMLASKIAMKIPFDVILDDIRHAATGSERLRLLTKKDLFNIEACFSLHSSPQRYRKDDNCKYTLEIEGTCSEKLHCYGGDHQLEICENQEKAETRLSFYNQNVSEGKKQLAEEKKE